MTNTAKAGSSSLDPSTNVEIALQGSKISFSAMALPMKINVRPAALPMTHVNQVIAKASTVNCHCQEGTPHTADRRSAQAPLDFLQASHAPRTKTVTSLRAGAKAVVIVLLVVTAWVHVQPVQTNVRRRAAGLATMT